MTDSEFKLWAAFKTANNQKSRDKLIINYMPLARSLARKHVNAYGGYYKDIVSLAYISLIKAVDTFDLAKQNNFGVYANKCISMGIIDELRLENKSARNLSLQVKRTGIPVDFSIVSLNTYKYLEKADPYSYEEDVLNSILIDTVKHNMNKLTPMRKAVIKGIYFDHKSYKELEIELGTSSLEFHRYKSLMDLQKLCA